MRARKITLGQDFVLKAIAQSPKAIVFLAKDAGGNITKKIQDKVETYNQVIVTEFTADELSKAIGKENRRVVLVADKGFIKKFLEYINS